MIVGRQNKLRVTVILEATLGGIRRHVVDLLGGLDLEKHDVAFVYSRFRADPAFEAQLASIARRGIHCIHVPMRRGFNPIIDGLAFVRIVLHLLEFSPEIIHLHGAKAGAIGRIASWILRRGSTIYNPHGGSFHLLLGLKGRVYRAIERLLARRTDAFVGVSKFSCDEIARHLGVESERVHLIHNGIDFAEIDSASNSCELRRADLSIREGNLVVLYPALFLSAKNHLAFLDALSRSDAGLRKSMDLLLAGDGPLRNEIARKITESKLAPCVRMLGFRKDLVALMFLSDIIILPSSSEVFGYVILEAMGCSRPVLATRVGGIPELVADGEDGYLFAPGDLRGMIDRIGYFAHHRDELQRLGENGRRKALSSFSVKDMIQQTTRLYSYLSQGEPLERL